MTLEGSVHLDYKSLTPVERSVVLEGFNDPKANLAQAIWYYRYEERLVY